MTRNPIEPWLRGTIAGEHPVITQLLYCFEQATEDLEYFTDGLSEQQMWMKPYGLASVGFQMRHIGGSIDRLLTCAQGGQPSDSQLAALKAEAEPGGTRDELIGVLRRHFEEASRQARAFSPESLVEERKVGRKQLPTTAGALLVHIAEHTQRHVGQAIVTAKILKAGAAA